jgi:hypothetical protein
MRGALLTDEQARHLSTQQRMRRVERVANRRSEVDPGDQQAAGTLLRAICKRGLDDVGKAVCGRPGALAISKVSGAAP